MGKLDSDLHQAVITNGCLQVIYTSSPGLAPSRKPVDASKLYTEHLDILLVLQGEITVKVFNTQKTLHENDVFICTQSTYSEISIPESQAFSYVRIRYIKGKLEQRPIQQRFAASLLNCDIIKYKIFNHCLAYVEFYESCRQTLQEAESQLIHQENLEILLVLEDMIQREHESLEIVRSQVTNNTLVTSAVDIFEENIESALTMEGVVEQLGVSHSYFVRVFKRTIGVVPNVFWRTVKVNYSLSLISLKAESLSDISYNLGFTDQSHFTNSFKKYLQFTPGSL